MIETISLQKDRRLLAWDVSHDWNVFREFLDRFGGDSAFAFPEFAQRMAKNLTGFIGELRRGGIHQLLSSYSYELPEMDQKTSKRVEDTADLEQVNQRARAIQDGLETVHRFFREHGTETPQVMVMSPVNEQMGETEHEMTAVYFLTYRKGLVIGRQLFIDLTKQERPAFMSWMANQAGVSDYAATDDLALARTPILSPSVLFGTPSEFMESVKEFLMTVCKRDTIGKQKIDDPQLFVAEQRRMRRNNQSEAKRWAKQYAQAVSQGALELGRRIITSMQMNVLGLTESAVREAAKRVSSDASVLELFLRACGFLEFTFGSGEQVNTLASFPAGMSGPCQEKICRKCGNHAGDYDTQCPRCGWKP